ncbi:MAG: DUF1573 domain-containing protein [Ignavibacteriaceae bacterium]|nr:DUF1573 domain-containing protein [Ignavibacteriaceae bacterium]
MFKKILLFLALLSACVFAQAIGPKITIPQTNYDYSTVPEKSTVHHVYMIYNSGDETLKFLGTTTSSKSVTAVLNRVTLSPTDSARLNVGYTNDGTLNGADSYVTIKTNDPGNPDIKIYITKADPKTPTLSFAPGDSLMSPVIYLPENEFNFGKMKQGDVVKHTFKVVNKGTATLRIRDISTSCGCTAAVVKNKDIPAGQEGEVLVQFDSSGKQGKLVRSLTIFSNDPRNIYKTIKIYSEVEVGNK